MGLSQQKLGYDPGRRFPCVGGSPQAQRLNSHKNRLGFESHAPDFLDTLLDLIFQGNDLSGGSASAIHDGQSVFVGEAYVSKAISTSESGMFDEPSR